MKGHVIESDIERLRDPFVLAESGMYYMYGTGWVGYKSCGSLTAWTALEQPLAVTPPDCAGDRWAPEVHRYEGAYYMFTTYRSSATGHRGCTIMRSDSPEGPFVEITGGHITPPDWDCIDGTFYVDREGRPWMVFVHEWTSTDDGVGRMAAAQLSKDLTRLITEPVELFRADGPPWAAAGVTDGCFLYTAQDGGLIMTWSNFDRDGYCVAVARSGNGYIDGQWIHDEAPLYSQKTWGAYDGGHAMVFTGFDGHMYLAMHSPNTPVDGRMEKPVFIPVEEKDGSLVLA